MQVGESQCSINFPMQHDVAELSNVLV